MYVRRIEITVQFTKTCKYYNYQYNNTIIYISEFSCDMCTADFIEANAPVTNFVSLERKHRYFTCDLESGNDTSCEEHECPLDKHNKTQIFDVDRGYCVSGR